MRRFATLLMVLSCFPGDGGALAAEGPGTATVERAFQRGTACLERDLDGVGFRDPYLSYVYPEERLPVPPGASRLTYRLVDAYMILAMLGSETSLNGALSQAAQHGEMILREAAPLWHGRGFNNTVRDAHPDGIALDTYCMVGWLLKDEAMAQEAAAAIEGDRWLPPGWYNEPEAFRAPADECWCLRLIAATTGLDAVPRSVAVLARIEREFLSRAREASVDTVLFYEAWHVGMVLAEMAAKSPGQTLAPDRSALLAEATRVLDRWALARPDGSTSSADVLEWSNLATADALYLAGADGMRLNRRALRAVISSQGEDGCWTIQDGKRPRSASSFETLRALLALQPHRVVTAAGLEPRGDSPDPAP